MRFVWKILPQPKMADQPLYGAAAEGREKETLDDQKKKLDDFLKKVEKVSESEKKDFLEKAKNWETKNDYATFRQAGITLQEDEKDPELRCRLLTSAFLEEITGRGRLTYKVNFRGNMLAEYKIGAGDITPPTVSVIAINGVLAVRAINPETGRKGFYWLEAYKRGVMDYAAVFTGDEIVFEETLNASDFLVQRRQIQERINLYQERGATATEAPEFSPREKTSAQRQQVSRDTRSQLGAFGREVAQQRESNDPAEVLENRRRLVEIAKKYAGTRYFQDNYFDAGRPYSADVQGGRLGCALVVSEMLREAGFMDDSKTPILGVALTENELKKRGWTKTNGPIEAGDVLVWAPAGAPVRDDNGQVRARHGHIGIAISPTRCVHNSNNYEEDPSTGKKKFVFKGPVEQNITRTPIAVWKPPGARPASSETAAAAGRGADRQPAGTSKPGGETIPTSREKPDTKLGRAIESATSRWLSLIQSSCEKYGIEKYVPLVRALMFMESGGRPNLVSKPNRNGSVDQGLMQLNNAYFKHPNIMDPAVNIDIAVRSLKERVNRYGGNLIDIITSYNCGHAEGEKIGGKVLGAPASTKNVYVPRVLQNLAALGYTDIPEHGNYSDTRYA